MLVYVLMPPPEMTGCPRRVHLDRSYGASRQEPRRLHISRVLVEARYLWTSMSTRVMVFLGRMSNMLPFPIFQFPSAEVSGMVRVPEVRTEEGCMLGATGAWVGAVEGGRLWEGREEGRNSKVGESVGWSVGEAVRTSKQPETTKAKGCVVSAKFATDTFTRRVCPGADGRRTRCTLFLTSGSVKPLGWVIVPAFSTVNCRRLTRHVAQEVLPLGTSVQTKVALK
mmetsp:Transcript_12132/g.26544  ORF Transcript_12132/g.26544 Transcript_12132/m.26544 type:complete len:225 (-) Transcript_12132:1954-2628(-)